MAILEVQNIKKSFGKIEVLKGIGFELEKGEVLTIIGSSGSGKTTLLRCLNYLEVPDNGRIVVNGNTVFDSEEKDKYTDEEELQAIAEKVGVGAIVFYYLSNNRMRDINFMMEDALSFDGNTGPYAQYTYARTCSVLEKVGECAEMTAAPLSELEVELAKTLSVFPERVNQAIADYEPSVVTRYILDLCAAFNRFYHDCSIANCDDAALRSSRIALTRATNQVLRTALHLICIQSPEKI